MRTHPIFVVFTSVEAVGTEPVSTWREWYGPYDNVLVRADLLSVYYDGMTATLAKRDGDGRWEVRGPGGVKHTWDGFILASPKNGAPPARQC